MSMEAMVWALKHAPVEDPHEHLVLIGLADHAGADGRNAWPSVRTLSGYARCSERTVRYRLRRMEERGLIVRGDQSIVSHLRADRRPVVYDLPIHGVHTVQADGVHDVQAVANGVHDTTARGAQPGTHGVHARADKPSLEPSKGTVGVQTPTNVTTAGADAAADAAGDVVIAVPADADPLRQHEAAFDTFWQVYPRRTAKAAAFKAWLKAVRAGTPSGAIIEGAARYAADPNRVDAFTKHPATWLNGGCWDDDPLPPRVTPGVGGHADRQNAILAADRAWAVAEDRADAERAAGGRLAIGAGL